ncbi:MAG TPA: beta-lactamase family protein [Candidatus Agrococcus pullicola]|uniref:Beta-lactamase family protein n=1 Tax=Candidatus Agrococcus pullicola TaxID=2838429 RepID=A0A9D1YUI0_9MICO|nr:beta-lactamase family protein [Candidatus Agrococcus pullicola]
MNVNTAIRKTVERLERTSSRRYPVPPTALISGPKLNFSAGDLDQPFWIASIDKVFIAALLGQLFDEGYCTPDTPIGRLLPAEELAPLPAKEGVDNAKDVTVQHLLSHTSGLPDVVLPPRGYSTTCSIKELQKHPERVWTIPDFLQQADHLPPFAKPGERFLYSDTAYLLLIRIIEEARDTGYAEQLASRIFEPSGMADSIEWVNADDYNLARLVPKLAPFWLGGSKEDDKVPFAPNLTWWNGMGGASTANDLLRFQRELHRGNLCDIKWVRYFGTPRSRFRPGIHYGTGMVSIRFGGFFPLMRGYPQPTGGLGYTSTHMFYYPQQDTHVILNYHAHRRMNTSFQMHIRIAGLINRYG